MLLQWVAVRDSVQFQERAREGGNYEIPARE